MAYLRTLTIPPFMSLFPDVGSLVGGEEASLALHTLSSEVVSHLPLLITRVGCVLISSESCDACHVQLCHCTNELKFCVSGTVVLSLKCTNVSVFCQVSTRPTY